jgi:hypothetical protein
VPRVLELKEDSAEPLTNLDGDLAMGLGWDGDADIAATRVERRFAEGYTGRGQRLLVPSILERRSLSERLRIFLEYCRLALIEETDLVQKLKFESLFKKAAWRFVQWLVAKAEGSKMHRNHHLGAKFAKRLESLLGIHVDIALCWRLISSDGKQGEFDVGALANFLESLEVSGVAAVEYGASGVLDEKASESSMAVVEDSCSPVPRWGKGDLQSPVFKALPIPQLMNSIESQIMDKIADMFGHGDRLVAGDCAQRAAIQVVEMRVSDKNEIDCWEIVECDSWMLDAFDDFEPLCPVGIYEHAVLGSLNQEGRVSDPCHANLSGRKLWKDRLDPAAVAPGKERGNNDLCKKVSPVPSVAEPHIHIILRLCALSCF